jgi:hypothetical protein
MLWLSISASAALLPANFDMASRLDMSYITLLLGNFPITLFDHLTERLHVFSAEECPNRLTIGGYGSTIWSSWTNPLE